MAGEWLFNPSVHKAKDDRLVGARALPVCDNGNKEKKAHYLYKIERVCHFIHAVYHNINHVILG